jgi:spermidine synthase
VRLIVADGRNYSLLADDQYDVIAADTIYPLHAYSSSLYSVDYYRLLATRLKAGGIMVQWVDTGLPEREQRVLIRTFLSAFPHVTVWQQADLKILMGSNESIRLNPDMIVRRFTPEVTRALAPQGVSGPEVIISGFGLADEALRSEVGPGVIISDDHPYNEYFRLFRLGRLWNWLEK